VRKNLFRPWLALATTCTLLMWVAPGEETVPYHVAWVGFALAYGLVPWTNRQTVTGLLLFTVATGTVLVVRASSGVIAWQETTEIPLMSLLVFLLAWHIRRRQSVLAAVTVMAEREREESKARERLIQRTSHEMRTPLTIARGYIEMLRGKEDHPERLGDLRVVDEELDRLTRVCQRLVRAIRIQGHVDVEWVDVDTMLRQTAERWGAVADRHWVVDAQAGYVSGSPERLRACLDTLIENALRYTGDGDTIRLLGHRHPSGKTFQIGVADSGSGLSDDQVAFINRGTRAEDNRGTRAEDRPLVPRDELSQTGLGLDIVMGVATEMGGRLMAARAPEGGALLVVQGPVRKPAGAVLMGQPMPSDPPPATAGAWAPAR
jgi:two-component system OmpR family sensor kinase